MARSTRSQNATLDSILGPLLQYLKNHPEAAQSIRQRLDTGLGSAASSQSPALTVGSREECETLFLQDTSNLVQQLRGLEKVNRHKSIAGFLVVKLPNLPPLSHTLGEIRRGEVQEQKLRHQNGILELKESTIELGNNECFYMPEFPPDTRTYDTSDLERIMEQEIDAIAKSSSNKPSRYYIASAHIEEQRSDLGLSAVSILQPDDRLLSTQQHYLGIHSSYAYVSSDDETVFPLHSEDFGLDSINVVIEGCPKLWLIVYPHHKEKLESRLKHHLNIPAACSQFVRHYPIIIRPSLLREWEIDFSVALQEPKTLMLILYGAYHCGLNFGKNIAEACNCCINPKWFCPPTHRDCSSRAGCGSGRKFMTSRGMKINFSRPLDVVDLENDDKPTTQSKPRRTTRPSSTTTRYPIRKKYSNPKGVNLESEMRIKSRSGSQSDSAHEGEGEDEGEDEDEDEDEIASRSKSRNKSPSLATSYSKSRSSSKSSSRSSRSGSSSRNGSPVNSNSEIQSDSTHEGKGEDEDEDEIASRSRSRSKSPSLAISYSKSKSKSSSSNESPSNGNNQSESWSKNTSENGSLVNSNSEREIEKEDQKKDRNPGSNASACDEIKQCIEFASEHHEHFMWPTSMESLENCSSELRRFDPDLSPPDNWLSDRVVYFLLRLMCVDHETKFVIDPLSLSKAFESHDISELVIPAEATVVIAPYFIGGCHWYLIVINILSAKIDLIDQSTRSFEVADFIGKSVNKSLSTSINWSKERSQLFPGHQDGVNCAIYVIAHAEALLKHNSNILSKSPVELRLHYLKMLIQHVTDKVRIISAKRKRDLASGGVGVENLTKVRKLTDFDDIPTACRPTNATHTGILQVAGLKWLEAYNKQSKSGKMQSGTIYTILMLVSAFGGPQTLVDVVTMLKSQGVTQFKTPLNCSARALALHVGARVGMACYQIQKRVAAHYLSKRFSELKQIQQQKLKDKKLKRLREGRSGQATGVIYPGKSAGAYVYDQLIAESYEKPIEELEKDAESDKMRRKIKSIVNEGNALQRLQGCCDLPVAALIPTRKVSSPFDCNFTVHPEMYNKISQDNDQLNFFVEMVENLRPKLKCLVDNPILSLLNYGTSMQVDESTISKLEHLASLQRKREPRLLDSGDLFEYLLSMPKTHAI
ncbi:MAG: Lysine-specific demethylase 4B [Vezdaea acicularis]|nr:MAG: Lysine-specific demethylase 4B [Vezdaea acicularis]